MFSILSHERKANRKYIEIPPHPSQNDSQNDCHRENKQQQMLLRMQGKERRTGIHIFTAVGNVN
jgi:hypothetical protein